MRDNNGCRVLSGLAVYSCAKLGGGLYGLTGGAIGGGCCFRGGTETALAGYMDLRTAVSSSKAVSSKTVSWVIELSR